MLERGNERETFCERALKRFLPSLHRRTDAVTLISFLVLCQLPNRSKVPFQLNALSLSPSRVSQLDWGTFFSDFRYFVFKWSTVFASKMFSMADYHIPWHWLNIYNVRLFCSIFLRHVSVKYITTPTLLAWKNCSQMSTSPTLLSYLVIYSSF